MISSYFTDKEKDNALSFILVKRDYSIYNRLVI